jgi:hypothetical protein
MNVLKCFPYTAPDAKHPERRLVIVARDDGHFAIAEQYFYRSAYDDGTVYAEGWATFPRQGIFASPDLAEQEILSILGSAD